MFYDKYKEIPLVNKKKFIYQSLNEPTDFGQILYEYILLL